MGSREHMVENAESLLASSNLEHIMPSFASFSSNEAEVVGVDEPTLRWTGEIGSYVVEIDLKRQMFLLSWGGKAHIQSVCGVVLDRVEVLPAFQEPEEAYVAICEKLDKRIAKMESSHITGSFPFVGRG